MRVIVQCQPEIDPDLHGAPTSVLVRARALTCEELSQLRRVLHVLVTTRPRTVTVDLGNVDEERRTNVTAVLIGAAREARTKGSTMRVQSPPAEQRRALFVADIEEVGESDGSDYEVVVGTRAVKAAASVAV